MASTSRMVALLLLLVVMSWTPAKAQNTPDQLPCVKSLMPCLNFINDTSPPASCCVPLKEAFKTQTTCLCTILKNPDLLAAAGNINVTQAFELPKNCGIKADPSLCSKAQAPASGSSASGPTASTPGKSGASKVGPVSGLVLLLVGFMFY